jgi:hypothetical protein
MGRAEPVWTIRARARAVQGGASASRTILGEGGLTWEHGAPPLLARDSLLVRGGITEKESELQ